ncbi:hypothetical protein [Streptomyces sp. NPDC002104]
MAVLAAAWIFLIILRTASAGELWETPEKILRLATGLGFFSYLAAKSGLRKKSNLP